MKIDKTPRRPRPPRTYYAKPKSGVPSGYGHGSEDKGIVGQPQWTLEEYRKMNRKCLRALFKQHPERLPRAVALNSIMDEKRAAQ